MEKQKSEKMPDLKLKVCHKQCDHCLFSSNRLVSLARKKEILEHAIANDNPFECHVGTMMGENIICRGFYERISVNRIRIAQRMDWVSFVDPFEIMISKKNNGTLQIFPGPQKKKQ